MLAFRPRVPRAASRNLRPVGLLMAAAALCAAGCAPKHGQLVEFLRAHEVEVSTGDYVVQVPDTITVHAPGAPEVDGARVRLGPDGKVRLRLLGEVDVAGLTTEEIAAKLEAQLSRYYVGPEVLVDVSACRSQYYYVLGHVASPGPKVYTGRDTLISALAASQPTFLAWRSQIRVVRPSPDEGERKVIVVNLDRMVRSGDSSHDVLLQAGDIVYVPPTPQAWLGLRIRELIYPVEPLIDAYTAPADVIGSHDVYEDEFGDDDWDRDRYYGRPYRR